MCQNSGAENLQKMKFNFEQKETEATKVRLTVGCYVDQTLRFLRLLLFKFFCLSSPIVRD